MSPVCDADFRSFRSLWIISLIGFPKPQMFIFYPIQKELRDNIDATLRHRRHSPKTLKTNIVEGLTVHAGCAEGNEEEIDCHSRIRDEHSHCHVVWPRSQSP